MFRMFVCNPRCNILRSLIVHSSDCIEMTMMVVDIRSMNHNAYLKDLMTKLKSPAIKPMNKLVVP